MGLPDFEAWAMFAAVADHGSFRAAAAASGVAVPTVSKAVARLEQRLGIALFHRTSRRVTLTVAGEGLAAHARTIVASGAAAEEAARADAGVLAGPIRLTAPLSFGLSCLGDPLAAFLAAYPGVTIDCILSDAQCDLVADGIDLALRIADLADSSLLTQTIAPVATAIIASPRYLAQFGTPAHPRELIRHRVLGYGHGRRSAPIRVIGPGAETVVVEPNGPLFVNNGEMMLPLLISGQAMAMLPTFILGDALRDGRLVRLLDGWQTPPLTLNMVSPPSRLRPARVRALSDHLVGALRQAPALAAYG
jgi:DNA-binding transcriptional LysR family regulator